MKTHCVAPRLRFPPTAVVAPGTRCSSRIYLKKEQQLCKMCLKCNFSIQPLCASSSVVVSVGRSIDRRAGHNFLRHMLQCTYQSTCEEQYTLGLTSDARVSMLLTNGQSSVMSSWLCYPSGFEKELEAKHGRFDYIRENYGQAEQTFWNRRNLVRDRGIS